MRRLFSLLGPALVAGVAYLDPGNVASNISAGAKFGFLLLWVVVLGNLIAWLVQYLSAKLGIVTGKSLPQLIGERITNKWGRRAFWVQAELVAIQARTKKTILFVTHDLDEAVLLADRVVVMHKGRITEILQSKLPRPRLDVEAMRGLPEFAETRHRLWQALHARQPVAA